MNGWCVPDRFIMALRHANFFFLSLRDECTNPGSGLLLQNALGGREVLSA